LQTINGVIYYFNERDGYRVSNTTVVVDGVTYVFDEKGVGSVYVEPETPEVPEEPETPETPETPEEPETPAVEEETPETPVVGDENSEGVSENDAN
ncbi:MAG: hypothetical protein K5679_00005, partial [Lachnospiraceae bacterium]|nr:hypothetical protein [Lachnospiraceae bacterium]